VPLLREQLAGMEIDVRLRDRMPAVESVLEEMAERLSGPFSMLRSVGTPGVDLPRFRAFAEAAAEFHRSALWNHLNGDDPIWIESAVPDPEFARFSVLGAAGMEYGLGFLACDEVLPGLPGDRSPRHAHAACGGWMLSYGPIMDLPLADSELWEREGLPLAGEEAYPFLVRLQDETEPRIADASRLTFVEGLLRALAKYLLGKSHLPDRLPDGYAWGSEEEAVAFGAELLSVWDPAPGARDWLAWFMRERKKARVGKRKAKRRH